MDWNQMLQLLHRLKRDNRLQDYLLIATGCYFGLRIKDLLNLRWSDVMKKEDITVIESKTGKRRSITVNENLKDVLAFACRYIKAKCHR